MSVPHYKVEEQPSKKQKKSFNPQNGKSDDTAAVAIVKTRKTQGQTDAKSLGTDSKNTIHSVCVKIHHQRSPYRYEI